MSAVWQFAVALVLPALLMLGWAVVQQLWRRSFGAPDRDGDVLAARGGCGQCDCGEPCSRRPGTPQGS